MTKITKLTPGQEHRLGEVYQEWLATGRSCEPLQRSEVKKIIAEFYSRIGKPSPQVLFFSSPAMCVLAYGALSLLKKGQLGGQLVGQLWGQLRGQLRGQLWGQLVGQLVGQLGGQLWDQLRGQLWGQLWGQLRGQLGGQLRGQLGGQLWGQLWGQLRGQLGDQLGGQLGDQLGGQLGNYLAGAHWCAWEVLYAFCGEIGVRYTAGQQELLDLWLRQSKHLHWWFPYEGIVLASERHTSVHMDDRGRLHHPTQMACGYSDGWGMYAWHGVPVPSERYVNNLNAREILGERNSEVRRALIERYDYLTEKGRWIQDVGAIIIDSSKQSMRGQPDSTNELLAIDLPEDPDGRMVALKVIDPSTGRSYIIRVPPNQKTVRSALAWSFNVPEKQYVLQQES